MKKAQAIKFCLKFHEANSKKNIRIGYQFVHTSSPVFAPLYVRNIAPLL